MVVRSAERDVERSGAMMMRCDDKSEKGRGKLKPRGRRTVGGRRVQDWEVAISRKEDEMTKVRSGPPNSAISGELR